MSPGTSRAISASSSGRCRSPPLHTSRATDATQRVVDDVPDHDSLVGLDRRPHPAWGVGSRRCLLALSAPEDVMVDPFPPGRRISMLEPLHPLLHRTHEPEGALRCLPRWSVLRVVAALT